MRLDILCAWIGPPSEKLWPFEFLESFRCSILSVSIYYAPESDLRVKSYVHLNFSRASVVQFRASLYVMRLNRTFELNVMTIWISWVCHILWWLKLSGGVSAPAHMFCFFSLQQHVFFFFSPKLFYLSISLFAVHTGTLENSKIQKKIWSWDFFIVLCISFARFLEVFDSLWWCWFHGHLLVPASLRFWYSSLSLSLTSGVVVVFHLGWDKGWFFGSRVLFFYYPFIFSNILNSLCYLINLDELKCCVNYICATAWCGC